MIYVNSLTACLVWIRIVLEKDLCTHCHKPFNGDAKMILEDIKINCHASCFKVSALVQQSLLFNTCYVQDLGSYNQNQTLC